MKNVLPNLRSSFLLAMTGSTVLILLSCFMLFFVAQHIITDSLQPEIKKKTHVIGNIILSPIQIALEQGIDIHNLRGVENHFEDIIKDNPQLHYIWLCDSHKAVLYAYPMKHSSHNYVNDIVIPISLKDKQIGTLHLGISAKIKSHTFFVPLQLAFFIIILLIILLEFFTAFFQNKIQYIVSALYLSMNRYQKGNFSKIIKDSNNDELSYFISLTNRIVLKVNNKFENLKSKANISSILNPHRNSLQKEMISTVEKNYIFSSPPQKEILSDITTLRISLFFFIMSESILIPLMPAYSLQLMHMSSSSFLHNSNVWLVLPTLTFTFTYVFCQPLLSFLHYFKKGNIHIFLIAGLGYAISLLGSACISSFEELIFLRFFSGFFFGLFIVTCRIYWGKDESDFANSFLKNIKKITCFLGVFYGALTCGVSLGIFLGDVFCLYFPFFISTVLACCCSIICHAHYTSDIKNFSHVQHFIRKATFFEEKNSFLGLKSFMSKAHDFFKSRHENNLFYLTFFIALPSRSLLSGVFLYALPTYFSINGCSILDIGTPLILFSFILYTTNFFIPSFVIKYQKVLSSIFLGNIILSTACLIPLIFGKDMEYPLIFTVFFALGFSMSLTSQFHLSFILRHINTSLSTQTLNSFTFDRFVGFIGFIVGPIILSILQKYVSLSQALFIAGSMSIILNCIYIIFFKPQQSFYASNQHIVTHYSDT